MIKDMNGEDRLAEFAIAVGTPGTGKTTLLKSFLSHNARNLVIPKDRDDPAWFGFKELTGSLAMGPDPSHPLRKVPTYKFSEPFTFTGTRVVHIDGNTRKAPAIVDRYNGFRDGGLFIDDFKNVLPSKSDLPEWAVAWLGSRRSRTQDIWMACHAFSDINIDVLAKGPRFFVFHTTVGLSDAVLQKVPFAPKLQKVIDHVNAVNLARPENKRHYFRVFNPGV